MTNLCPTCGKSYDYDGFYEHRLATLYYCTCGAIFDTNKKLYAHDQIDWCEFHPDDMVGGLFINAKRIIDKGEIKSELTNWLQETSGIRVW